MNEQNLTDEELQILEDVKPNKQATITRQLLKAREEKNKPLEEKIKAEIDYREKIGDGPGLIITMPINKPEGRSVDGRRYTRPGGEEIAVRFLPFQTNFAQPGFAQRVLRKGAEVKAIRKSEVIADFLRAIQNSDGGEHYRLNMETFEGHIKGQKVAQELSLENEELKRKIAELEGQQLSIKPKEKKNE